MKLYNSLTRKPEEFQPISPPKVGLYTCGQTVYDYTHIGHGRKYTNDDCLRRALTFSGYDVRHVQNVTDVGHLVSDADEGEDKLEKGAKKTGKTVWEVAQFFTDHFYQSLDQLNILRPNIICKATDHIPEQIELIKKLLEKSHAYETKSGIFFSIDTFPKYRHLFGQDLLQKKVGSRSEVIVDPEKKNPADFALWFKAVGRFENHAMQWDSPWGKGFPGWHIECSAMSMKYLGETFDIHTGGEDHLPIHHPNEIAQSEAATGKPFVRYWLHTKHLLVDGKKMSKSLGNFYTVEDVQKKGIDPLALRYLFMQTHYRQQMNFTWESLQAAQDTYNKLKEHVVSLRRQSQRTTLSEEKNTQREEFEEKFKEVVANDLQLPQAVAVMWEMLKSNIPSPDKLELLLTFDEVLGLRLSEVQEEQIPEEVKKLAEERQQAKKRKKLFKIR